MKLRLNKLMAGMVMAGGALTLVGCGGSDAPDLVKKAAADVTVPATAATIQAIANTTFAFPSGVPALGTTGPTTFGVGGTAAQPTFSAGSGGKTASGDLGFGSCILKITTSTFDPPSPLAVGSEVRITPCNFKVATAGSTADGNAANLPVTVVLGTASSDPVPKVITISPTGAVAVNGVPVGTVTVEEVATGSGPR